MRHKIWQAAGLALLMTLSTAAQADGLENMERLIGHKTDSQTRIHKPGTDGKTAAQSTVQSLDPDAIRLTPDRVKILTLKKDAVSVVVTNPAHAVALLDSPRTVILMPRSPGTTSLVILDRNGEALFERNIIVSAAQNKYVRIRRICPDNARNCTREAYYYCPDGCFEINPVVSNALPDNVPAFAGVATPAAAEAPMDDADDMIESESERPMRDDDIEFIEDPNVPQMDVPPAPVQQRAAPEAAPAPVPVPLPVENMEGEE